MPALGTHETMQYYGQCKPAHLHTLKKLHTHMHFIITACSLWAGHGRLCNCHNKSVPGSTVSVAQCCQNQP